MSSLPSLAGVAPYLAPGTTRTIPVWPTISSQPASVAVSYGTPPSQLWTIAYDGLPDSDQQEIDELWGTTGTSTAFLWPDEATGGWRSLFFAAAPAFADGRATVVLSDRPA